MLILGTLQHISFISKFHDDFTCCHAPKSVTRVFVGGRKSWNTHIDPGPSCPISLLTLAYGLMHRLAGGLGLYMMTYCMHGPSHQDGRPMAGTLDGPNPLLRN